MLFPSLGKPSVDHELIKKLRPLGPIDGPTSEWGPMESTELVGYRVFTDGSSRRFLAVVDSNGRVIGEAFKVRLEPIHALIIERASDNLPYEEAVHGLPPTHRESRACDPRFRRA
jgi:hypothetical protein